MQVWNVLLAARCKYKTQRSRQKSPSGHHRITSSGYIFATMARIDNRKTLVKQQYLLHMSLQYGELRPTSAWLRSVGEFGAPLQISTGFASWQRYCTASSSGRQPNFAALNRGRHLCSAVSYIVSGLDNQATAWACKPAYFVPAASQDKLGRLRQEEHQA